MTVSSNFNKIRKSIINTIDHVIHPYGPYDPIPVPEAHETDQAKLWDEWNETVAEFDKVDIDINELELIPEHLQYVKPKEPYVDPIKRVSPWDRFNPK